MRSRLFVLVLTAGIALNACSKKSEEFQESLLKTAKQQTLYGIKYGSHQRQVMDICLPAHRNTQTPVVVLIHGGAWIMGDKGYFYKEMEQFAEAGIACATINYRYASDITNVHHPDIPNDIQAALDFIASKSVKWQVAPDKFGICGHSAGGHLALTTAYTLNDGRIKACGSWAGVLDLTDTEQRNITGFKEISKTYMGFAMNNETDTEKYRAASPYHTVFQHPVPTLLLHGTKDIGVPYSNAVMMDERLDSIGVQHQLYTFNGSGHIWTGNDLNNARSITLSWFKQWLL